MCVFCSRCATVNYVGCCNMSFPWEGDIEQCLSWLSSCHLQSLIQIFGINRQLPQIPRTCIIVLVCNKEVPVADLIFFPGCQRARAIEGSASAANIKPQLNGLRPPHTPTHPFLKGPPSTPVSKLPRMTLGPSRGLTETSGQHVPGQGTGNTQGEISPNFA